MLRRVAIGIGVALAVMVALAVNVAGAIASFFLPVAIIFWLFGDNLGLTFWETFAWVEFVGGMIGAGFVLLFVVPAQLIGEGILSAIGALAIAAAWVAIALAFAFGFGIIGGDGSDSTAQAAKPLTVAERNDLVDLTNELTQLAEQADSSIDSGTAPETTETSRAGELAEEINEWLVNHGGEDGTLDAVAVAGADLAVALAALALVEDWPSQGALARYDESTEGLDAAIARARDEASPNLPAPAPGPPEPPLPAPPAGTTDEPETTREEFAAAADAICAEQAQWLESLSTPESFSELVRQLRIAEGLLEGTVSGIRELDPPTGDEELVDEMLDAFEAAGETLRQARRAAERQDGDAVERAVTSGEPDATRAGELAFDLGLQVCSVGEGRP